MAHTQVADAALSLLFAQIARHALDASRSDDDARATDHEAAFYRVEALGAAVGTRLAVRVLAAHAGSKRAAALGASEPLEAVKYVCREVWPAAFGKAVDGLKTNHRGTFVLQDDGLGWVARFAALDPQAAGTTRMSVLFLAFPCGILRGALAHLGLAATVTAEVLVYPQVIFHVRTTAAV